MGYFSIPKGVPNKRYTPEFKQMVVEAVLEGHMAYNEAERHYLIISKNAFAA